VIDRLFGCIVYGYHSFELLFDDDFLFGLFFGRRGIGAGELGVGEGVLLDVGLVGVEGVEEFVDLVLVGGEEVGDFHLEDVFGEEVEDA
jgi:hypothetical protein